MLSCFNQGLRYPGMKYDLNENKNKIESLTDENIFAFKAQISLKTNLLLFEWTPSLKIDFLVSSLLSNVFITQKKDFMITIDYKEVWDRLKNINTLDQLSLLHGIKRVNPINIEHYRNKFSNTIRGCFVGKNAEDVICFLELEIYKSYYHRMYENIFDLMYAGFAYFSKSSTYIERLYQATLPFLDNGSYNQQLIRIYSLSCRYTETTILRIWTELIKNADKNERNKLKILLGSDNCPQLMVNEVIDDYLKTKTLNFAFKNVVLSAKLNTENIDKLLTDEVVFHNDTVMQNLCKNKSVTFSQLLIILSSQKERNNSHFKVDISSLLIKCNDYSSIQINIISKYLEDSDRELLFKHPNYKNDISTCIEGLDSV